MMLSMLTVQRDLVWSPRHNCAQQPLENLGTVLGNCQHKQCTTQDSVGAVGDCYADGDDNMGVCNT